MSKTRIVALQNNTRPPVPELGRIRLGDVKIDPKRPGKPLPYFRVDFHPAYKYLEPIWNELYPDPPAVLDNVFAAYPDADLAFTSAYEDWGAAQVLNRRCDGQTIHQHYNPTTQRYEFTPKPCQCAAKPKPVCRLTGRFSFILRDLFEFANQRGQHVLGYFIMSTSSSHNIQRIDALLHGLQVQHGSLQGIPFRLERTAEEVSTPIPENKDRGTPATRIMKTHYFVNIRTADSFAPYAAEALLTVGSHPVKLPVSPAAPMLPEYATSEVDDSVIEGEVKAPERRDCLLTGLQVSFDNRGSYMKFQTDQGFAAYTRDRNIFINAGWIIDAEDWTPGTHNLSDHIPAIIERYDEKTWQVVHVFAAE